MSLKDEFKVKLAELTSKYSDLGLEDEEIIDTLDDFADEMEDGIEEAQDNQ